VPKFLEPGDEIHCLHCHRWHPVHCRPAASETPDSTRMLFWECRGHRYYAGHVGTQSHHPARSPRGAHLPDARVM
jgi:hypothetical protein